MRKNRHNNGYIGIFENKHFDGILSPCKNYLLDVDTDPVFTNIEELVSIPIDGGGYGATASCTLKNGELATTAVLNTGGGYTFVPLIYVEPPPNEPYPIWCRVTRTSNTISSLSLTLPLKEIIVQTTGTTFTSTPTITIGGSALGSSSFTASITGKTMNVSAVSSGIIYPRSLVAGSGIAANTIILDYGPGATGRIGDYTVNNSQTRGSASASSSTTATAVAVMNGSILAGVSLTYSGLYENSGFPTVTFSTTPRIPPSVYPVFNTFSGYTLPPNIINLSGGTATFSTSINAEIDTINIINGGTGYVSEPTVSIVGVNPFTSNLRSVISGGSVVGVTYSRIDTRFSTPPVITIGGFNTLPSFSPGEEKLVANIAVVRDGSNSNIVSFTSSPVNIDWGDGTTGAIFNGGPTYAFKTYTDQTYDGLTLDSPFENFKTVTMTLTPFAGASLTNVNFNTLHPIFGSRGSNLLEVAISAPGLTGLRFATNTSSSVVNSQRLLRSVKVIGTHQLNNGAYLFANLISLQEVEMSNFSTFTGDVTGFFSSCTALKKIPKDLNFINATGVSSFLTGCTSIKSVGHLNVPKATNLGSCFSGCTSLRKVEKITTSDALTSTITMFFTCSSLKSAPVFDTGNVTNFSNMFGTCPALENVPPYNTQNATDISSMFNNCTKLKEFPYFDFGNVTTTSSTFAGIRAIKLPDYNFAKVQTTTSMFSSSEIEDVSNLNFPMLTTADSMFSSCRRLVKTGSFDSPLIFNIGSMFSGCSNLQVAPRINFTNVTTALSLFNNCLNLEHVPDLYLPKVTNLSSILGTTSRLKKAPKIYAPLCTLYSGSFGGSNVETIENIDFTPVRGTLSTSGYSSLFASTLSLREVLNCGFSGSSGAGANVFLSTLSGCPNLTRLNVYGISENFTLPNPNKLGFTALNEIYTNLPVVGASGSNTKTITVTGSQGVAGDNPNIAIYKGWAVSG